MDSTVILVERSGYELVLALDDRIDDIVVNVVEGTMSEVELVAWFRARIQPLPK